MNLPRELEQKILSTPGVVVTTHGPTEPEPVDEKSIRRDEAAFQAAIIKEAKKLLWKCYHTHRSLKSEKGFPDLTLARGKRVIFAELKTEKGKMSAEQTTWVEILSAVGGNVYWYLWRPSDWPQIMEVLK